MRYLVVAGGRPLYRSERDGVLWACGRSNAATTFPTRREALKAVEASLGYSARTDAGWSAGDYAVCPVIEVPLGAKKPKPRGPSRRRLLAAVRWALGEAGEFPERPTDGSKGAYYWRSELRRRAGL